MGRERYQVRHYDEQSEGAGKPGTGGMSWLTPATDPVEFRYAAQAIIHWPLAMLSSLSQPRVKRAQEQGQSCREGPEHAAVGLRELCQQSLVLCLARQVLTVSLSQILVEVVVRHDNRSPFSASLMWMAV